MRSIHLGLYALFTSAVLMVSCAEDELIENNHHLTSSETINFDAIVEWPKDYMDSRSATSSLKRVESPVLRSEEGSEILPMGVYVQDGIYPITTANPESRGAVITKGDLNSFNVWATLNKAQSVGGGSIEYIAGQEFTNTDGVFSSNGTKYYWPGEGPTIDFLAVGNANDAFVPTMTGASGTFIYTVPTAATAQNDIVVAKAASIPGNKNASVSLDFQHIMSAVNVKVGSEMTAGTINSITFKNIKSKGTYDVASGAWTNVGTPTDYTVTFADGSNVVTESTAEGTLINGTDATFMMIPQTLSDVSETDKVEIIVNFKYATTGNETDLTASISGHEWAMGKTTNYFINVSPDFILTIEEESVAIADCHYDTRTIKISDESNVGWTLTSNVDWVKFRVMPADYATNANYKAYKDHWIETHTVVKVDITLDQTKTDDSSTTEDERITQTSTTSTYPIVNSLSGTGDATILVYYYENTGSSDETTRTATVSLKDSKGNVRDDIEIQQYYPLWGTGSIAYERIEEDKSGYPWGFASSRTITYTYPDCEQKPSWATGFLGGLIWAIIEFLGWDEWFYESAKETRGSVYNEFYTEYYLKAPNGFITISPSGGNGTTDWGYTNEWSVTLNYSKLNDITATNPSGLINTQTILTYGGGETGSDAETYLISKSLTKGTEASNTDKTTIPQTAAYQAVKKNRWNITTTITTTTTITKDYGTKVDDPVYDYGIPVLVDDDIKWFLPSNDEIATLKSTACDADDTNNDEALSGTYWTSTSAADVKAYEYAEDATSGTVVSRVATTKHKIRAARMKP